MHMTTVLLLDDERSFNDDREALVARSTDEAIELTDDLCALDELWLDFVLSGSDSTTDFLRYLHGRMHNGNPLELRKVFIHTSSWNAVGLLKHWLNMLKVSEDRIERVEHQDFLHK
jgi:hypothetical protein